MPSVSELSLYVAALAAVYLLPGPDMAMVMSASMGRGVRHGLLAAVGLATSRALHVALSGLGLAAVFAAHPLLFDVVRWAGAAYLLWLAWKLVSAAATAGGMPPAAEASGSSAVRRGFLTNLLNPKALMFCALLLPQFIDTAHGGLLGQYLLLGAILVGLGLFFDTVYSFAASAMARRLGARRSGAGLPRALFAGVFVLAALRLAMGEART